MTSISDRLTAAADRLAAPTLCNTNPWDVPLAEWLREAANDAENQLDIWGYHVGHCGWNTKGDVAGGRCLCFDRALTVAATILEGA